MEQVLVRENWHRNYAKEWVVFFFCAAGLAYYLWKTAYNPPLPIERPPVWKSDGANWFFVLRMPEVPHGEAATIHAQDRMTGWIQALYKNGFRPMLLSDVHDRLKTGIGLPEKAVVLLFEPGYHHTYESLKDILFTQKSPGVWITDQAALKRGDRRYIHGHNARFMVQSQWWDVGFYRTAAALRLETGRYGDVELKRGERSLWSDEDGTKAINWGLSDEPLNRLNVEPNWTPQDLADRLLMEMPLLKSVQLTTQMTKGRLWGIIAPESHAKNDFHLKAPLHQRSASLYWVGTKGTRDLAIELDVPRIFGGLVLWLRSNSQKKQGLRIAFTEGAVSVEHQTQGKVVPFALHPWPVRAGIHSLRASITLKDRNMQISYPGTEPVTIVLPPETVIDDGIVRLTIHDKVRGAAYANSIKLIVTPLKSI